MEFETGSTVLSWLTGSTVELADKEILIQIGIRFDFSWCDEVLGRHGFRS